MAQKSLVLRTEPWACPCWVQELPILPPKHYSFLSFLKFKVIFPYLQYDWKFPKGKNLVSWCMLKFKNGKNRVWFWFPCLLRAWNFCLWAGQGTETSSFLNESICHRSCLSPSCSTFLLPEQCREAVRRRPHCLRSIPVLNMSSTSTLFIVCTALLQSGVDLLTERSWGPELSEWLIRVFGVGVLVWQ